MGFNGAFGFHNTPKNGLVYAGTWNASTNNPTLTSGIGTDGYYYIVDVPGNTNLDGVTDWQIGDWAIFSGTVWQKLDNSGITYQGNWDALTNTPTLVSSVGDNGHFYIVSVAGSTNLNGITIWNIGDWAIFTNGVWLKIGSIPGINTLNTLTALSQTFSVGTTGTDFNIISAASNHAFNLPTASSTNRGALSSTDWSTFNNKVTSLDAGTGILIAGTTQVPKITNTLPDQTVVLNNGFGISVSGTYPNFTITNSSPSSGGTVTNVLALSLGIAGTDLNSSVATPTTTPVITLNVPNASATNRGALTSSDWTTFNNKQNALTNPVTGTGTNNEIAAFNSTGSTITSLPTATYPNLTELSYSKGVTSAIQTQLNNKADLVPNVQSVVSAAIVTPTNLNDEVVITAQAVGLTLANPTGIAVQGQSMIIRIKDNGVAQTIGYSANYRAIGVTLPTTTVASKIVYLGLIYNSTDTKWDVIGVSQEA